MGGGMVPGVRVSLHLCMDWTGWAFQLLCTRTALLKIKHVDDSSKVSVPILLWHKDSCLQTLQSALDLQAALSS